MVMTLVLKSKFNVPIIYKYYNIERNEISSGLQVE